MLSTQQVLLHRITQERSTLFYAIDGLPEAELVRRPLVGDWSAKDILGHVAAWEVEMTRGIEQFVRGERPTMLDISDCDAWNAEQARLRWDLPLREVVAGLVAARKTLLDVIAGLPDDAFARPGPAPDKRPFIPGMLNGIADHDREHWAALMQHKVEWVAAQQVQA